jgi:hypothetical protein
MTARRWIVNRSVCEASGRGVRLRAAAELAVELGHERPVLGRIRHSPRPIAPMPTIDPLSGVNAALETASPAVMLTSVGEPEPTVASVRAASQLLRDRPSR